MATAVPYSRPQLVGVAILGFVLSGCLAWFWVFDAGFPERASLATAQGRVAWHRSDRYGVEFGLDGTDLEFDYPSKANAADRVEAALEAADEQVVTVLYEHEVHGPIGAEKRLHTVYEVAVGGRVVRSFAEVREAWEADDAILPWLLGFFVAVSTWLLWMSGRLPEARRS